MARPHSRLRRPGQPHSRPTARACAVHGHLGVYESMGVVFDQVYGLDPSSSRGVPVIAGRVLSWFQVACSRAREVGGVADTWTRAPSDRESPGLPWPAARASAVHGPWSLRGPWSPWTP